MSRTSPGRRTPNSSTMTSDARMCDGESFRPPSPSQSLSAV
jgi:hypothetical protein